MVSPKLSHFHPSSSSSSSVIMPYRRSTSLASLTDFILLTFGTMAALIILWVVWPLLLFNPHQATTFKTGIPDSQFALLQNCSAFERGFNTTHDPPHPTFYDDPNYSYFFGETIKNWDDRRREWLKLHPSFIPGLKKRVMVVTGSQSKPCANPMGDHLLLRFFKNKVDYCRIHGYDIFYNNVLLHPEMFTYWAKTPAVKAAMLAHPEAEWIWWVDADAVFTDMDFKLPLERYEDHNFIVHGWPPLIYEKKSWTSLNAGVFLIRNCQWSLDFMDVWSGMGPQNPNYEKWGKILRETCKDKFFPESDDQTGLVYLLLKEKEKWGSKVYIENGYYFEGYWLDIEGTLAGISEKYAAIERRVKGLRRRRAEKVRAAAAAEWEEYLKDAGNERGSWRRPFVTHFTGCQPCTGSANQTYSRKKCVEAMEKVLNFADDQVLRSYGYMHRSLEDSSSVKPLPFDYPA